MKKIRKAVVPVAGYGTRLLPASKSIPKEMLPIIDRPVIHYVVEDLVEAGIEQIILVTSSHKKSIEDYFDKNFELEHSLADAEKFDILEKMQKISKMAEFVFVRQKEMRGTGDAILTAKNIVGDEPFVVTWGDEITQANPNKTKQLLDGFYQYGGTILGGIRTDNPEDKFKYAFVDGPKISDNIIKVESLIEKPGKDKTTSDLAIIGGSVYSPDIFKALEECVITDRKELFYVDGINALMEQGQDAFVVELQNANYYDCGNIAEYLKTNVRMGLKRDDIGEDFKTFIKKIANEL